MLFANQGVAEVSSLKKDFFKSIGFEGQQEGEMRIVLANIPIGVFEICQRVKSQYTYRLKEGEWYFVRKMSWSKLKQGPMKEYLLHFENCHAVNQYLRQIYFPMQAIKESEVIKELES